MIDFFYQLRRAGIPVSLRYVLELYRGLQRGLAANLDQLFLLSRLIFVKKLEHYDAFEQVFSSFFLGRETEGKPMDWEDLLAGKPFHDWLRDQIGQGLLTPQQLRDYDTEELLRRFWETVLAQRGEHHGGNTWVGTRGRSPYGHGGLHGGGVRVHGSGLYGTAQKVIEKRNYLQYSGASRLSTENLRQVLASLKSLQPAGPETDLDVDESIALTARNGGEIELVFRRELRNRLKVMVFLDNGGWSMAPYVNLVRTVFRRVRDVCRELKVFYFHNCIYGTVYEDEPRTRGVPWEKLLNESRDSRVILFGDANMAPAELMASYGSLDVHSMVRKPGIQWLKELRNTFPCSVWLNPIPKDRWSRESSTIRTLGRIFPMEDLTLGGIQAAVAVLNTQGRALDR